MYRYCGSCDADLKEHDSIEVDGGYVDIGETYIRCTSMFSCPECGTNLELATRMSR